MHSLATHEPTSLSPGGDCALFPGSANPAPARPGYIASLKRRVSSRLRLRLQMQELVDINRRKDEVLATVCHELRSPLASIGSAARLLGSSTQAPVRDKMQALITREVARMECLVNDLLDVSRIANGHLQLQLERLDLRFVVNEAVETVAARIEDRQHQLTVVLPDAPVWIDADALRLEQVLVNLLCNAAKYTNPGGKLALSVEVCGTQAVIRLRDSGIGISPQLLPHVFDLFRQADDADTHSRSGLGIGLAIVRSLVELHAGSVTAESKGCGRGSDFIVRLPLQTAQFTQLVA